MSKVSTCFDSDNRSCIDFVGGAAFAVSACDGKFGIDYTSDADPAHYVQA